uniref:Uncharacterized protein n=1 Tax=Anguilla anguilla TaxID=7936 RepID=A0A0E9RS43_ANGAN
MRKHPPSHCRYCSIGCFQCPPWLVEPLSDILRVR